MAALWSEAPQPPGAARQQAISSRKDLFWQMHFALVPQPAMPLPPRNLLAQDCCREGRRASAGHGCGIGARMGNGSG